MNLGPSGSDPLIHKLSNCLKIMDQIAFTVVGAYISLHKWRSKNFLNKGTQKSPLNYDPLETFNNMERGYNSPHPLKGLAMIFAGQENPLIIFRSKEIYIYFKTNIKIPINLLKLWEKQGFWQVSFLRAL